MIKSNKKYVKQRKNLYNKNYNTNNKNVYIKCSKNKEIFYAENEKCNRNVIRKKIRNKGNDKKKLLTVERIIYIIKSICENE